ncbi:endonuclease/exonuclease/phosphatase family protein [Sphingobacterium corticibacterium]|uniref:Endonuclease n=1 Tax=Sphingobacterium corticibacterium TaxID=2484746 RepID=A0A4Q6XPG5_9SPHI|nr:endonuclease/exonuclease/phosphatase family protein [Sphingobacterium corticibacterium]RZF61811.1 endonuclease [Sphingobacterium corticibacterium]
MISHRKKYWRKVLSVSFLPIVCGLYFTKTTHSNTNSISYIEEHTIALEERSEGELSLLTYNVAGLPDFLSAAVNSRASSMKEISKKINRFDIVNVQEDFHYHHELYGEDNRHRYRTEHKMAVPYGDGLNTLSKYPIQETRRIPWQHCNGSDCLAAKGFSFSRITIAKSVNVDVYNIHATARDDKYAATARQKNIEQLVDYITTHSASNAIIVMGDFNAHFAAAWDNLSWFTKQTGVQDVWVMLMKNGKCPLPYPTFVPSEKLTLTDSCESIDKIFFRNSTFIEFCPQRYKLEKQYFTDGNDIPLSDHYAISCILQWKKK